MTVEFQVVGFLGSFNMHSHPHRRGFNMKPCWACGENLIQHTVIGKEKQCKPKKQFNPQSILWLPQNRRAHIKRKALAEFFLDRPFFLEAFVA
jgi:hypothetical protein